MKKTAKLHTVPSVEAPGYAWKWRGDDQRKDCAKTFVFYHDCLSDAREHGYHVELARPHGVTAPTGSGFSLIRPEDER